MTATATRDVTDAPRSQSPRNRSVTGSRGLRPGHVFVSGYVVLLALFGVIPVVYSVYLAFTKADGGFAGFTNFVHSARDYRLLPAVGHVAAYVVIWLLALTIFVTVLALVVHRVTIGATRAVLRFCYYIPGALAGASSVLLWLFVLDPTTSPVGFLLRWTGNDHLTNVIAPGHLPVVFAIIAFWTGAGGWILVLYGALNTIPEDVMEAARVDGAGPLRMAWSIQLPLIRKWVVYMLVLSVAAGTQLFVEPELVSQASFGIVPNSYSVNQLAYQFAFTQNDFNGSAAISIDLLIVALLFAGLFVARGRLFETD